MFSANDDSNNKKMWYLILSFIDYAMLMLVYFLLKLITPTIIALPISIISLILLVFIFSKYAANKIQNELYKNSNKTREHSKLSYLTNKSALEEAFDKNNILVFIFDFNHNYITDGYVSNFSPSIEFKNQILLQPQTEMSETNKIDEEYVSKIMDKYYGKTNIYIDTDQKLKYYIIYLS